MTERPTLAAPRRAQTLEAIKSVGGGFDVEMFHVMDERDNALIADEVLQGAMTSKFVYSFNLQGTEVSGVSVVGARHLAAHYGGMKHRMVASAEKNGALFTFTSYPREGVPMQVTTAILPDLEQDPDFYAAVIEVTDIKTGNSLQVERREARLEKKRDGSSYERPHYRTIAQSKAYRNAVLALIPQDVQMKFKMQALQMGKGVDISESIIEQKRNNALKFAASKAIPLAREMVQQLTFDQLAGLAESVRDGEAAFRHACVALGLLQNLDGAPAQVTQQAPAPAPVAAPAAAPALAPVQQPPAAEAPKPARNRKAPAAAAPAQAEPAPAPAQAPLKNGHAPQQSAEGEELF